MNFEITYQSKSQYYIIISDYNQTISRLTTTAIGYAELISFIGELFKKFEIAEITVCDNFTGEVIIEARIK